MTQAERRIDLAKADPATRPSAVDDDERTGADAAARAGSGAGSC